MEAVALFDDGWAIRALPPGRRDLGCFELWDRSLARSRRRRERAARRTGTPVRAVSAALITATVVAPAADLATSQDAVAATHTGMLKRGARGPDVAAIQRALGVTADGAFGRQTRAAVRAFQARNGLEVDGVVGPITRAALGGGGQSEVAVTTALQQALGVAADGEYGPVTRAAVRSYQVAHGLEVDGVAGPETLGALGLPTGYMLGERSVAGSAVGGSVIGAARAQMGKPYEWAGNGPASFDCSGLTVWAFRSVGIALPRTTYGQVGMGAPVSQANIQPGDLVFFDTDGSGPSHVGIATSATTVISATASAGVIEHTITGPYWGERYVTARRVG